MPKRLGPPTGAPGLDRPLPVRSSGRMSAAGVMKAPERVGRDERVSMWAHLSARLRPTLTSRIGPIRWQASVPSTARRTQVVLPLAAWLLGWVLLSPSPAWSLDPNYGLTQYSHTV